MWMSSMTSGVKMRLWPRRLVSRLAFFTGSTCGATFSCDMMRSFPVILENDLLLGRLEIVVVPQLLTGHDLGEVLDAVRRLEPVELQLALQELHLEVGHLALDRVDAEAGDLAADIDRAVIHGIAEVLAGVTQDDHAAALHHEAAEGAGAPADQDGAALLVDADAGADIALAHQVAAADRGAEGGAGVLLDDHAAAQHVLRARPADAAGDVDVRPVDQAAAEIAQAALDVQVEPLQQADRDAVLGAGVVHDDGAVALAHQLAQLEIDLLRRQRTGVELGALVEVDIVAVGIEEVLLLARREETLLVLARQLFGVHAHLH